MATLTMGQIKAFVARYDAGCWTDKVNACDDGQFAIDWFNTLEAHEVVKLASDLFGESNGIYQRVRDAAGVERINCPSCDHRFKHGNADRARDAFPWTLAEMIVRLDLDANPGPVVDNDPNKIHVVPSSLATGTHDLSYYSRMRDECANDPITKPLAQVLETLPDESDVNNALEKIIIAAQRMLAVKG